MLIKVSPALLLTIFFIILKLIGFITWGWLWVLSPLWIPWLIVFVYMVIYLLFLGIVFLIANILR